MTDASPADPHGSAPVDWAACVRRLSRTSVCVIGDVMLDRFVYGRVERVSYEAPVPVIMVDREVAMPGGAGNVVRNLTALDAAVAFVAVVGDDQPGSELTGLVGGQPGVEPWLLVQGGRLTTVKTRYIASGQHLLRADQEDPAPIHARLAERMIRIARDAMLATKVTVLSDYAKGMFAGDVAPQLIAIAKSLGRPVIVDPKGATYARYAGADLVTPSLRELGQATGMPVATEDQIAAAALSLIDAHAFKAVLVTRAGDGMTLVRPHDVRHFPAEAADVYDVSGAGDSVVATLAAGIAAGLDLPVAVRLSNLAAGVVVGKVGTAVAREADLLAALSPQGGALRKVVGAEAAAEQAERWRQRGWKVGLTLGVFDLLHPGHVHLLDQARAACDRLVVGLTSDISAATLKGPSRPVQPEAARAAVLASLANVDLVSVYDQETHRELIAAVRPDVLIKGPDAVPEAATEQVKRWGGQVVLAELLPGHSTSATVARLIG